MPASPFEFVRLAVLPSIRPPGVDQTASMDLPEEGVASISGTGGGVVDLSFSVSHSWTRQIHDEAKRKYDIVRTFYTRPDGTIDYNSYVEWEVVRQVSWANGDKEAYGKPEIAINMELIQEGLTREFE